jgi:hypothetical protein
VERHRHGLRLAWSSDTAAPVDLSAFRVSGEGDEGRYRHESEFWLEGLPDCHDVVLTVSWPEIGLPEAAVTLQLPDLAAAVRTSIPLR